MPSSGDKEEWREVPRYEGYYEVSSKGRVRSVTRKIVTKTGVTQVIRGRLRKTGVDFYGYPSIKLCKEGNRRHLRVHGIVLRAFVGPRPPGKECCHKDGNHLNNRLENLRYDTRKKNEEDKEAHGRKARGSRHGMSKLTEGQVLAIRQAYANTASTYRELGEMYGVTRHAVSLIVRRKRWKHI